MGKEGGGRKEEEGEPPITPIYADRKGKEERKGGKERREGGREEGGGWGNRRLRRFTPIGKGRGKSKGKKERRKEGKKERRVGRNE